MPTRHRSGWQKQSNKGHKRNHRSKRDGVRESGGKVNRSQSVVSMGGSSLARSGKQHRQNHAAMLRKNKRDSVLRQRRLGGGAIPGAGLQGDVVPGAPKNVAIILLSDKARRPALLGDKRPLTGEGDMGVETIVFGKEKFRASFFVTDRNNLCVLDAAKTADIVCFVLPLCPAESGTEMGGVKKGGALETYLGESIDEAGRQFITLCKAQGLPSVVGIVQNLEQIPTKHHSALKKQATNFFEEEFGYSIKVIVDENPEDKSSGMQDVGEDEKAMQPFGGGIRENMTSEQFQFVRALMETPPKHIAWRSERSYMLGCSASYSSEPGVLAVSGYLRGRPLSANQVAHIPGEGNFYISRIESTPDPFPLRKHMVAKESSVLVVSDVSKRPSLVEEAEPDLMAGEQTWPTEDEMGRVEKQKQAEARAKAQLEKEMKKLPPGTSEYQAAWLMGISDDEEDQAEEDEGKMENEDMNEEDGEEGMDYENPGGMTLAEWKKKQKEEQDELEFPDEVETPVDISARERFAKYRGLKSFRTSPWHPKESLPREYAHIFQLQNPIGMQNEVLRHGQALEQKYLDTITASTSSSSSSKANSMDVEMEQDNSDNTNNNLVVNDEENATFVLPGQYVTIYLENVPSDLLSRLHSSQLPLVVGSLLDHETKLSVLNCSVLKAPNHEKPVKARDQVVLSCGIWRRPVRPTYSENAVNCDKHKFERFLHAGRWSVATAYAPVTFGTNVPTILLEPESSQVIATGSLMSIDPDRVVLKKVVLSGYPIRVKKTWAVIRYMFFRPEDIRWFKPVDLWTKYGMSGRILEPLGTHGLFKCSFNKPIKNHDTVCMSLYKRVFPKPVTEFNALESS